MHGMLSVLALTLCTMAYGQPVEPEVPGDNFSLEGALDLFKKSKSPEDFERLLNSPDSKVNNLDLNGDGYIDYIRVFDRTEKNVHAFILQAVISDSESQDIAVIELEKLDNGKAVLQIIGDEDIYGVETIIEPTSEVRTYAGTMSSTTVVNVWAWPSVQYVYGPYYNVYYSPWRWHAYPVWWRSWRPVSYVHYYPIYHVYRPYYSYCHTRRISYAYNIYRPYRTTSVVVYDRHRHQITDYRSHRHDDHRYGSRSDRGSYDRGGRSRDAYVNHSRDNRSQYDRSNSRSTTDRDNTNGRDNSFEQRDLNRTRTNDYDLNQNNSRTTERHQSERKVDHNRSNFDMNSNERRTNQESNDRRSAPSESMKRTSREDRQMESQQRSSAPTNREFRSEDHSRNAPSMSREHTRPSRENNSSFEMPRQRSTGGSTERGSVEKQNQSSERRAPSRESSPGRTSRSGGESRR
jgi:hypothetical protein